MPTAAKQQLDQVIRETARAGATKQALNDGYQQLTPAAKTILARDMFELLVNLTLRDAHP